MKQIDYIRRLKIFIALCFGLTPIPLALIRDLIAFIGYCRDEHPELPEKFQELERNMIEMFDSLNKGDAFLAEINKEMNQTENSRRMKLLFAAALRLGSCPKFFIDSLTDTTLEVERNVPRIEEMVLWLEQSFVYIFEMDAFGLEPYEGAEPQEGRRDLEPDEHKLKAYYTEHFKMRN
jgi:hypothetical protein